MDFITFTKLMKEEVTKRVGGECTVKINETMKNNGLLLTGITILEDKTNISPTIYLDDYYDAYMSERLTIQEILDEIMLMYQKHKVNHKIDIDFFTNFEKMKDKIIFKLINKEMNEELLKDVPFVPYHDLALVFQCLVVQEELGNATILIHNVHLELWKITLDDLYQIAVSNTPRLYPYELKHMRDIIMESLGQQYSDDAQLEEKMIVSEHIPMYVLSNKARLNGATALVYQDILKDFAHAVKKNLYILPSSIHEGATCFAV